MACAFVHVDITITTHGQTSAAFGDGTLVAVLLDVVCIAAKAIGIAFHTAAAIGSGRDAT
jgi:hypothetical protein